MHSFRTLCILDVLFYIAYSARHGLFVLMCLKTHITHSLTAVGAGGDCLDIFTLLYPFSPLSPSLWETARYRLKYCLKGLLSGRVAQSVGHPTHKSEVLGSIPGLATYFRFSFRFFKKGSCQLLAKVCARSTG